MAEQTEQDWVKQAARGKSAAVAELYQRYWRAARAAAYGVTGNLSLAADDCDPHRPAFQIAKPSLIGSRTLRREYGPR